MASRLILLVFTFLLGSRLTAQNIVFNWQNCIEGEMNVVSRDIVPISDGYLVVAQYEKPDSSYPSSNSTTDVWLLKLDNSGNVLWGKFFGGSSGDGPSRLVASSDGYFYIINATSSEDGDVTYDPYPESIDFWIIRIDSVGNKIWDKMVGGSCREYVMDGVATSDGGVVAMGFTCSADGDVTYNFGGFDIWAFKLDSTGNKKWNFTLGSSGLEIGYSVLQTSDGGYLLCGMGMINTDGNIECVPHSDRYEGLLVKLDSNGVMQWQRCYGGSEDDGIKTLCEINDGYILVGITASDDGDMAGAGYHYGLDHIGNKTYDIWISRVDLYGNIIWQKCFGGSGYDSPNRILKTGNNLFIFGITSSFDGDVSGNHSLSVYYDEIWVLKVSSSGTLLWQRCIGGKASEYISSGVVQKSDSTWVVAASAQGTSTGDIICGPPLGETDYYIWAFEFADTNLYASTQHPETIHVTVKPNPAGQWAVFDYTLPGNTGAAVLTIQDALGRKIEAFVLTGQKGQKLWNTNGFPDGIYFYSLRAGTYIKTDKLLIRK